MSDLQRKRDYFVQQALWTLLLLVILGAVVAAREWRVLEFTAVGYVVFLVARWLLRKLAARLIR